MKWLLGLLIVTLLFTGCAVYVPPIDSVGVTVGPHGRVGVGVNAGSGYSSGYYPSSSVIVPAPPAYIVRQPVIVRPGPYWGRGGYSRGYGYNPYYGGSHNDYRRR
jgi:hypothetical protein